MTLHQALPSYEEPLVSLLQDRAARRQLKPRHVDFSELITRNDRFLYKVLQSYRLSLQQHFHF